MKLELTQHARLALAKRGIPLEWVERAVAAPQLVEVDPIDPALEHRLIVVPEYGGRVLRVVLNPLEPLRIITAYPDRRMKGKL